MEESARLSRCQDVGDDVVGRCGTELFVLCVDEIFDGLPLEFHVCWEVLLCEDFGGFEGSLACFPDP